MKNETYSICVFGAAVFLVMFVWVNNLSAEEATEGTIKKAALTSNISAQLTPDKYSRFSIELIKERNKAHRDLVNFLMDPDADEKKESALLTQIVSLSVLLNDVKKAALSDKQNDLAARIADNQSHYLEKLIRWHNDLEDSPSLKKTLRAIVSELKKIP